MKLISNKCIGQKIFKEIVDIYPSKYKRNISTISFKKIKTYKDKAESSRYILYTNKDNKYIIYIKPYLFYITIYDNLMYDLRHNSNSYSYYTLLYTNVMEYIFIILNHCNGYNNTFNLKNVKGIDTTTHSHIPWLHRYYMNKDGCNTNILKDFGGVFRYIINHLYKLKKNRYKNEKFFDFNIAQLLRFTWTKFQGEYSIGQLKRYVFGKYNYLVTDYSWKQYLLNVAEPTMYVTKFDKLPRKYPLYTEYHKRQALAHFLPIVKAEQKKMKDVMKKIGEKK